MRAASKQHRLVTVQALVEIQSANGQMLPTWVDQFGGAIWAQVIPVGASERLAAAQVTAEETARFKFRWRADWQVSPKTHRIAFPSSPPASRKFWDITGIAELGRREGWEITATADSVRKAAAGVG